MEKIPTLFERDPGANFRYVRDVVHPACQWVIDGEGTATRKFDGTCVMFDGTRWWTRREIKPGRNVPPNYVPMQEDPWTGKIVGWEPANQSSWYVLLEEALDPWDGFEPGTYELCGPKINKNPEGFEDHVLVTHGKEQLDFAPRDFDHLREYLLGMSVEGIVWWHPDGRRAKLKRKDFQA